MSLPGAQPPRGPGGERTGPVAAPPRPRVPPAPAAHAPPVWGARAPVEPIHPVWHAVATRAPDGEARREAEADRTAAAVLGSDAPTLPSAPAPPPGAASAGSSADGVRRRAGELLGRDFSGVRLHHDAEAGRRARGDGAHAVATGADVYFAPGRFRPDLPLGRALIAHELTHVAQQGAAPPRTAARPDGDPWELWAPPDRAGHRATIDAFRATHPEQRLAAARRSLQEPFGEPLTPAPAGMRQRCFGCSSCRDGDEHDDAAAHDAGTADAADAGPPPPPPRISKVEDVRSLHVEEELDAAVQGAQSVFDKRIAQRLAAIDEEIASEKVREADRAKKLEKEKEKELEKQKLEQAKPKKEENGKTPAKPKKEQKPAKPAKPEKTRLQVLTEMRARTLDDIVAKPDHIISPAFRTDVIKAAKDLKTKQDARAAGVTRFHRYDAFFNDAKVTAALAGTGFTPADLKALVAQESLDLVKEDKGSGISGIAQLGPDEEKEAGGKKGDRNDPQKALVLAAKSLKIKMGRLDKLLSPVPVGDEHRRFVMGAYNAGEQTIVAAQKEAIALGRSGTLWADLVTPGPGKTDDEKRRNTPLYKAYATILPRLDSGDKLRETSDYVRRIDLRTTAR